MQSRIVCLKLAVQFQGALDLEFGFALHQDDVAVLQIVESLETGVCQA